MTESPADPRPSTLWASPQVAGRGGSDLQVGIGSPDLDLDSPGSEQTSKRNLNRKVFLSSGFRDLTWAPPGMIRRHGWLWHARVIPVQARIPACPRGRQLLASSMVLGLRRNGATDWALGHHALEQGGYQDHQTSSTPRLGLSMQVRFDCFDQPSYY